MAKVVAVQFEDGIVIFFPGFGVDLLCELDHGLKMRVVFLLSLFENICSGG